MLPITPCRSVLYMPGSNVRALEKAKTLAADVLILDLEDAVAPDMKIQAREQVCEAVKAGGYGRRKCVIRMNGLDTEWADDDMEAAIQAQPDAILAPKVSTPDTLIKLEQKLQKAPSHLQLWIMVETPEAFLSIRDLAYEARKPAARLSCFVLGLNDLTKDLRARFTPGRHGVLPFMALALAAARMQNLDMIDGVFNTLDDENGFIEECEQARNMGFDGKTLIHPAQIEIANRVFAPSAQELEEAHALIDIFNLPENQGQGAINFKGRMVERLHRDMALRVVALAEAINV